MWLYHGIAGCICIGLNWHRFGIGGSSGFNGPELHTFAASGVIVEPV